MIFVIAFLLDILAAIYGFKTARSNGRNGILWAGLVLIIGIGFQFIVPFLVALVLASVGTVKGDDPELGGSKIGTVSVMVFLGGLMVSIMAMIVTLQFAATNRNSRIVEKKAPPEPPRFRSNDY